MLLIHTYVSLSCGHQLICAVVEGMGRLENCLLPAPSSRDGVFELAALVTSTLSRISTDNITHFSEEPPIAFPPSLPPPFPPSFLPSLVLSQLTQC